MIQKFALPMALVMLCSTTLRAQSEPLFVAMPFTEEGSFTDGIEGPACDSEGNVYAVNWDRQQTIGRVTPQGKTEVYLTLPNASCGNGIRFGKDGSMFIADYVGHTLFRCHPKTKTLEPWIQSDRMNQPNDLTIAKDGTIYLSDPDWKRGTGQVWKVTPDRTLTLWIPNMGTSNGIEVSPDQRTLYVNESVQRTVWAFPINDDGSPGERKLVYRFDDASLDGMRADVDGNLYVTRHGAGRVVKLSPEGSILREIDVLGTMPSNICFGGEDGCTAYVTEVQYRRLVRFRVDRPGYAR